MLRSLALSTVLLLLSGSAWAVPQVRTIPTTFCNPMNLDYAYVPKLDYSIHNAHRSTADPACVYYQGRYWLFATNQEGYFWSTDLGTWHYILHRFKIRKFKDDVCAPAVWPTTRGLLFLPCFSKEDNMPLYLSTDPLDDRWQEVVKPFPIPTPAETVPPDDDRRKLLWDPSFFEDTDKRLYLYWGSSNTYPITGIELDPAHHYRSKGDIQELIHLDPQNHGWERFGENNQNGGMDPFMEGAWMNRFGTTYYLQYGAPGTEFNVYGDGVYTSDKPLGPFKYQEHNPFSWKPTGFIHGAGHGSTFVDRYQNVWHMATMQISVKNKFERRLGIFPAGVDHNGTLFADTGFGDYPHRLATGHWNPHQTYTGWTLLSYRKTAWSSPSKTSTSLAFDEDVKTYWAGPDGKAGQFLAVDLGAQDDVSAIQINYADEKATLYGKQLTVRHRYQILASADKQHWQVLVDKSRNRTDVPHDYVELTAPYRTRYLKLVNIEVPTGSFAISGFRVFGHRPGPAPAAVSDFSVERNKDDRRDATLHWTPIPGAYAYNVVFGNTPSTMYSSLLVYGDDHYDLHGLNIDPHYAFAVQAVGETGLSPMSKPVLTP